METIRLQRKVLNENDVLAAELRNRFAAAGILCLNLVSSPGSGKTTLLERTLERLREKISIGVIEGDVHTDNDARRLAGYGVPVHQIETGGACHLDAKMINRALKNLPLDGLKLLFIENIGNLVCPSSYDLGEDMKVAIVSTTEGDDKPQKYPAMFARSGVLVINKTDLLPHVDFDTQAAIGYARALNPDIRVFKLSCKTGEGIEEWCDWLLAEAEGKGA
ncbi:MAG TPA: hydrogenase nickel incorporation protein HypB [Acidobacteriota bacterium]|nr:hydrogenase nickel incorporation protein HypB [Acidobacteriota bacterium]